MPKFIHGQHQQMQQIVNEIIDGLQKGTMVVENIDAVWDKANVQRYQLNIVDVARTTWLARQHVQMQPNPSWATTWVTTTTSLPKPKPIEKLAESSEPLIGYRDFVLGSPPSMYPTPGLISRNKTPWPMREPMRAFCKGGAFSAHDAPSLDCECGIYAFNRPDHPDLVDSNVIWGEIAMWGDVLICGDDDRNGDPVLQGYRAEFAYPQNLFVRDTGTKSIRWLRDSLVDSYGVPVFLVPERQGKTAGAIMGEMLAELTKEKS